MNYILEIRAFYDWLELNQIDATHISLWHGLMHIANKTGWQQEFAVPMSTLEFKTGLKRSAIYEARNKLKQLGLIDFKERSGSQCSLYKLCPFNGHNPDTIPTQSRHNPDTIPTQSPCINKHNNINNNNNYIAEPENNTNANGDTNTAMPMCVSDDFKCVKAHYEKYPGNVLSDTACVDVDGFLTRGIEKALICYAIDASINANARNWAYVAKIINTCVADGVLTLEEHKRREVARQASKSNKEDMPHKPNRQASKPSKKDTTKANKFANFKQRDWDYKQIEKMEEQFLIDMINNK